MLSVQYYGSSIIHDCIIFTRSCVSLRAILLAAPARPIVFALVCGLLHHTHTSPPPLCLSAHAFSPVVCFASSPQVVKLSEENSTLREQLDAAQLKAAERRNPFAALAGGGGSAGGGGASAGVPGGSSPGSSGASDGQQQQQQQQQHRPSGGSGLTGARASGSGSSFFSVPPSSNSGSSSGGGSSGSGANFRVSPGGQGGQQQQQQQRPSSGAAAATHAPSSSTGGASASRAPPGTGAAVTPVRGPLPSGAHALHTSDGLHGAAAPPSAAPQGFHVTSTSALAESHKATQLQSLANSLLEQLAEKEEVLAQQKAQKEMLALRIRELEAQLRLVADGR